jgi:plastocyanin
MEFIYATRSCIFSVFVLVTLGCILVVGNIEYMSITSFGIECNYGNATIYILNIAQNSPNLPAFSQKAQNSPNLPASSEKSLDSPVIFRPSNLCININGTVTWINNDTNFHTIASGNFMNGSSFKFISPILSQNQNFSHVFDTAGIYDYYDPMNPQLSGSIEIGTK